MAKPTYSTCIGLILKGYDDYEHNRKQFENQFQKVGVPDGLKKLEPVTEGEPDDIVNGDSMKRRKNLTGFWGKFKDGIIELFKEEEDKAL